MRFVAHSSARAFLERAGPWLLQTEAENNLILGLALARQEGDLPGEEPAWWTTVEEGSDILGAAFRTPPHMVGLTGMPGGAVPLVARMADDAFHEIPGVVGPAEPVEAFVKIWTASHPVRARLEMRMGIYALETLVPPEREVPGTMRRASPNDLEMLVPWMEGFESDTGIFSTGARAVTERLVGSDDMVVWEVRGTPVCMAAASGETPNGVRVGYVYTPPELRGRGYAAALTAALTRSLLDAGKRFCFLYTNLGDPVSNRIYRRLGYVQISDATAYRFDPA